MDNMKKNVIQACSVSWVHVKLFGIHVQSQLYHIQIGILMLYLQQYVSKHAREDPVLVNCIRINIHTRYFSLNLNELNYCNIYFPNVHGN